MVPDLVVHGQPDEPTKQQVVIQLLHQHPLTTDGVEDLQQRSARAVLAESTADRWGMYPPKKRRQIIQGMVDYDPDRPQWMVLGSSRFRRDITKHRLLFPVFAAHSFLL